MEGVFHVFQNLHVQLFFGREEFVERAFGDAHRFGDLFDCGFSEAVPFKQGAAFIDQLSADDFFFVLRKSFGHILVLSVTVNTKLVTMIIRRIGWVSRATEITNFFTVSLQLK